MTSLDDSLRPTAARLVATYGKAVTLTRSSSAAYDPATGTAAQQFQSVTLKAVIDRYGTAEIVGGLAERGDVKLTIADIDPPPAQSDSVSINGIAHNIVTVSPVFSGELIATYEIQARRT